jgi:hypothetical protein
MRIKQMNSTRAQLHELVDNFPETKLVWLLHYAEALRDDNTIGLMEVEERWLLQSGVLEQLAHSIDDNYAPQPDWRERLRAL